MNWIEFLADVGAPIFGSLVMAFFIFLTLKYILEGVLDNVKSLTGIISMLEDRARVMNNDIIKIDLLISQALELRPDLERVARAENFVEDGSIDARRD
jgi:hypothetical protein|tara:strand:- start:1488 stop:1781 length:294 start_codon:yes stop_codon:yes gene_type:complete